MQFEIDFSVYHVTKIDDDRSPMAKAMSRSSEIIACCLLMIVPALIGYWVDGKLATGLIFTIAGLVFGMTGAIWQLQRLVASTNSGFKPSDGENEPDREN